jgi:hypothetical protein
LSRRTRQRLGDITFDAMADQNRIQLAAIEGMIYRKGEAFTDLIAADDWSKALEKMELLYEDHGEKSIEGLSLVRRTEASMELLMGMGRWDQAEQVGLSFLALRAGRTAEIARMILAAASLAQRDIPEALPRLNYLSEEDIEAARLRWVSSILDPSQKLSNKTRLMLRLDPITKANIELIERYLEGVPVSSIPWKNKSASKLQILGDIARYRIWGQSDIALDKLEAWVKKNEVDLEKWPHGQTARALLYLDRGMVASALNIVEKTMKVHPRHPHLRRLAIHLAEKGEMKLPASEPTGLIWADTMTGKWEDNWVKFHNVAPTPVFNTSQMKSHSWNANSWTVRKEMPTKLVTGKTGWKSVEWPTPPLLNHLIMTGLVVTVGGVPVDLGFPGWIKYNACEKANLLDLSSE